MDEKKRIAAAIRDYLACERISREQFAFKRFDHALPYLRASVAAFGNFPGHYNSLISCCGHLGLIEEAQGFIATRSRMGPPLSLSVLQTHINSKFANRDVLLEGLRKAGVPEQGKHHVALGFESATIVGVGSARRRASGVCRAASSYSPAAHRRSSSRSGL
jgi:hypothetical protein